MSTKVPITILLGEKRFVPSSSDVFLQEISVAFQRRDLFALDFGGFVPSGAWPRWSYGAPPFRSLSPPGDVGSM